MCIRDRRKDCSKEARGVSSSCCGSKEALPPEDGELEAELGAPLEQGLLEGESQGAARRR
eukprot:655-Alexandrium_andersonii.AAC.1